MQADRIELDGQILTFDRTHQPLLAGANHTRGHFSRVVRAYVAGKYDRTAEVVSAIGVKLAHHRLTQFLSHVADHRARHAVKQQIRLQTLKVFHQQPGSLFVTGQVHIQGSVGFEVLQGHALNTG